MTNLEMYFWHYKAVITKLLTSDARADALRYRWLRDNKHLDGWWSVEGPEDRAENIDSDIDTAMQEDDK